MKILFRPSLYTEKNPKQNTQKGTTLFPRSPLIPILALSKSNQSGAHKPCRAPKARARGPPTPFSEVCRNTSVNRRSKQTLCGETTLSWSCPGKIPYKKQTPTGKYFAMALSGDRPLSAPIASGLHITAVMYQQFPTMTLRKSSPLKLCVPQQMDRCASWAPVDRACCGTVASRKALLAVAGNGSCPKCNPHKTLGIQAVVKTNVWLSIG